MRRAACLHPGRRPVGGGQRWCDADLLPALLPGPRPGDRRPRRRARRPARDHLPRQPRRPGEPRCDDRASRCLRGPDDAGALGLPAALGLHTGRRRRRTGADFVRAAAKAHCSRAAGGRNDPPGQERQVEGPADGACLASLPRGRAAAGVLHGDRPQNATTPVALGARLGSRDRPRRRPRCPRQRSLWNHATASHSHRASDPRHLRPRPRR